MNAALPDYYFRVREDGAFVFRVATETRKRRIEMDQIAVVNIKNGEIKAHGDGTLSDEDLAHTLAHTKDWMAERTALLAHRDINDIHRAVDYLNFTTHWAESRVTDQ